MDRRRPRMQARLGPEQMPGEGGPCSAWEPSCLASSRHQARPISHERSRPAPGVPDTAWFAVVLPSPLVPPRLPPSITAISHPLLLLLTCRLTPTGKQRRASWRPRNTRGVVPVPGVHRLSGSHEVAIPFQWPSTSQSHACGARARSGCPTLPVLCRAGEGLMCHYHPCYRGRGVSLGSVNAQRGKSWRKLEDYGRSSSARRCLRAREARACPRVAQRHPWSPSMWRGAAQRGTGTRQPRTPARCLSCCVVNKEAAFNFQQVLWFG